MIGLILPAGHLAVIVAVIAVTVNQISLMANLTSHPPYLEILQNGSANEFPQN